MLSLMPLPAFTCICGFGMFAVSTPMFMLVLVIAGDPLGKLSQRGAVSQGAPWGTIA